MAKVEIYTTMLCPYCWKAKKLLNQHGAEIAEIDVLCDGEKRTEMQKRAGGRTSVPQIFINGQHIGGCDDLYTLEQQGKLLELLNSDRAS